MPGKFGSSKVLVLFSLQDLKQIKEDFGKFSDDPDRYIETFQNSTEIFELSWSSNYATFESDPDEH